MTRLLTLALVALVALVAVPSVSAQEMPRRLPATNDSIFAPLPLPTPNAYRSADGRPGPDYWQQRNDYRIRVALDPTTHTVSGTVALRYTNNSPEALDFLWMHLEQNLFAPESRGSERPRAESTVRPEQGYRITSVTVGGRTITPTITDTRMRVDLPSPVAANGGTVDVEVAYSFVVPGDQTPRMGRLETAAGTVYAVAQWYPRVAVYDDVSGWNALPYLGQGEFYLGYGDFDYEITVPANMTVVGTGTLTNESEVYTETQRERLEQARRSTSRVYIVRPDEVGTAAAHRSQTGTTTWKYRAENVRDVAWAASTSFIVDGANAAVRQDDGTVNNVLILSAYPQEGVSDDPANPGWEEATRYGRAAILNNSKWFPYPYPEAVSVATHVGGMEYPMLHFSDVTSRHFDLFGVVDHELGHNWFPMIVGSDERRYAWMDEGFNTFLNYSSAETFYNENDDPSIPGYGQGAQSSGVQYLESDFFAQIDQRIGTNAVPIMTYPDVGASDIGWIGYLKPGKGLLVLREGVLGPDRFDEAFKTYIRRWAYKHPQPADFIRTMEDVTGEDLDWFWREWLYGTDRFDAALTGLTASNGEAAATVSNRLPLVFPTVVEFTFTNGTVERATIPVEAWMGGDEAVARVALNGRTIQSAELDPDGSLPDADRTNDTRTF